MASARIHRQSCEAARLPPVCICCGGQATQRVRTVFNCEPTWQIIFLPAILLLMLLVGVFTGLKLKRLYNPLAPHPIEFPVPVCDEHRGRLSWHRYFLWALIALLLLATAVLLPLSISIAAARGQDVSGREAIMQGALIISLIAGALLLLASMLIKLFTPRVVNYTASYVDMASLAPEFVDALRRTSTATAAGYGQSMGVTLTAGMSIVRPNTKSMLIVGSVTLALVGSCCMLGVGLPMLVQWNSKQNIARRRAERAQREEKTKAQQETSSVSGPTPKTKDPARTTTSSSLPPPPSSLPPAPSSLPPAPSSLPPAPPAAASAASSEPSAVAKEKLAGPAATSKADNASGSSKRLQEFKSFSFQKFPPDSREIRDASELAVGMEVWAYIGPSWYRGTVVRTEGTRVRVKLPPGRGPSEMPFSIRMVRVPTD